MQVQCARERMVFIDAIRGLAIIFMALDHVRDFFGVTPFALLDLKQTTSGWFVTRYITHLCAPIFVFLAGCSAWLYGQALSKRELSRYLVTRGFWLIFLECTFISLSWGALLGGVVSLQVIWVLGLSMVLLAALLYLPRWAIGMLAVMLMGTHNLLDGWQIKDFGEWGWLWSVLHEPAFHPSGVEKTGVYVAYPLLPWLGVMLAGYFCAPYLQGDARVRHRRLLIAGGVLLLAMLLLRATNWYGDPHPWEVQARGALYTVFSFFHFEKYPPSLLYLCITLGFGAWILAALAYINPARLEWLTVYGRVPMFFYLLHLPMIHLGAQTWAILRYEQLSGWDYVNVPAPKDYEPSLLFVYLVWLGYLAALYFACRWYGALKRRKPNSLLRYV